MLMCIVAQWRLSQGNEKFWQLSQGHLGTISVGSCVGNSLEAGYEHVVSAFSTEGVNNIVSTCNSTKMHR